MKIVFIIPYFGKFPQWFQMFLSSLKNIESADFLIFTDDLDTYTYPSNTKVIYTTFNAIQDAFKEKLGSKVYLQHPYKLCDYKPLYGEVFIEHVTEYPYWGYCDLDMVFGDFDGFLKKYNFFKEEYDRFSSAGHLTIYKNTPKINSFYKSKINEYDKYFGFDFAKKTSFPVHFDEVGMNILSYQNNLKYFDTILYGHVPPESEIFTVQYTTRPEIIYRYNGKILASYLNDDDTIETIEMMYLHIMRRGILPMHVNSNEDYYITHTGFHPFEFSKLKEYLLEYGTKENLNQELYFKKLKKGIRKKSISMILRECRDFPSTFIPNIFKRFYGVRLLRKIKY